MKKRKAHEQGVVRRAGPAGGAEPRPAARLGGLARGWLGRKWPVIRFMLVMAVFLGAFFAATSTRAFQQGFFPWYMSQNASWSAGLLRVCGEEASSSGASLRSPRFAVEIRRGCEAIEPTVLFVAAVVGFPVSLLARVLGVLLGLVALSLLNLVRIVSLFYVGIYWPNIFEMMHVEVWQPAFIVLALALWIAWAVWATRRSRPGERSGPSGPAARGAAVSGRQPERMARTDGT